jgi:hypothetical protein
VTWIAVDAVAIVTTSDAGNVAREEIIMQKMSTAKELEWLEHQLGRTQNIAARARTECVDAAVTQ